MKIARGDRAEIARARHLLVTIFSCIFWLHSDERSRHTRATRRARRKGPSLHFRGDLLDMDNDVITKVLSLVYRAAAATSVQTDAIRAAGSDALAPPSRVKPHNVSRVG